MTERFIEVSTTPPHNRYVRFERLYGRSELSLQDNETVVGVTVSNGYMYIAVLRSVLRADLRPDGEGQ